MEWQRVPGVRPCIAFLILASAGLPRAWAADAVNVEFDPSFLAGMGGRKVDLSRFAEGNVLSPGIYRTDVVLNERPIGSFDVALKLDASGRSNLVCIDDGLIQRFNLDPAKAPEAVRHLIAGTPDAVKPTDPSACRTIGEIAQVATARFDATEQRLEISIPQIFLSHGARGYVPPERWDSGITAGLLSYHYSAFRSRSADSSISQQFLNLRAGANLGDYRLRHDASVSFGGGVRQYQSIATNVQRDVTDLLSTLTLGDGNTDGQLFGAFGFRGVQLASDDRMLPDSQRGYSPVVRGEALSNARVSIRQNGVVLYETVVPPGPFAIDDLHSAGFGGDLQVTITEADGSQRTTIIPFSPMPQLLRESTQRYAVTAGTLRNVGGADDPFMLQGTYQRGLSNWLTAEGGLQATPRYAALLIGGAFVTPVGSFALDATHSRFDSPNLGLKQGTSLRASYSKFVAATQTSFLFAAYRNSTVNYYSLHDTTLAPAAPGLGLTIAQSRSREYASLTLQQALGASTSVAFSSVAQSYWNRSLHDCTYRLTLSQRAGAASVGFTIARDLPSAGNRTSTTAMLALSLPLDQPSGWSSTSQVAYDKTTGMAVRADVSGAFGDSKQIGVTAGEARYASSYATSIGGGYRGGTIALGGNLSRSSASTQASISADGGLVVHAGGITFANSLGDAVGLVYAPTAAGASVMSSPGATVNDAGYALIPYLNPYTRNDVELDMQNTSMDSQLDSTVEQAVPRSGAVVRIAFKGHKGRNVLIQARAEDGSALPFSGTVVDDAGGPVGLVGQGSRIEANVAADSGRLTVRWGDGPAEQCTLDYHLPPPDVNHATPFTRTEGVCKHGANAVYSQSQSNRNAE